jgi:hypothetical protein
VVDLVLEQVRQQALARVDLRGVAQYRHGPRQVRVAQAAAMGDQAQVRRALRRMQGRAIGERFIVFKEDVAVGMRCFAAQLAFERIEIKPVACEDVVQGELDGGEKTDARGLEFGLGQLSASLQQTVVGPAVVIRLAGEVVRKWIVHDGSLVEQGRGHSMPL